MPRWVPGLLDRTRTRRCSSSRRRANYEYIYPTRNLDVGIYGRTAEYLVIDHERNRRGDCVASLTIAVHGEESVRGSGGADTPRALTRRRLVRDVYSHEMAGRKVRPSTYGVEVVPPGALHAESGYGRLG